MVLRPGRHSKAALSDGETGHGRNWAVEGKPGAGFYIKYNAKDQSVTCEHA